MEKSTLELSPKGVALLAAARSGLLPRQAEGFDEEAFDRFWEQFSSEMEKRTKAPNYRKIVFRNHSKNKAKGPGNNRRRYSDLILASVSSFSVCFILSSLLKADGFGSFFLALLLCAFTALLTLKLKDAFS
ncbi:hypothetical protein [uncultured Oscillibacter sp.]|uniref:hypothetical protein n=1 Tax=uncultured Oscillibacter sp. TaxID=876091 RepID=UPI00261BD9AC|nr:hypothetical protein [uncultured Oscillibacter sp.]